MSDYKIIDIEGRGGKSEITVRGKWDDKIADELAARDFEKLILFGIDWPDFKGLKRVAPKVKSLFLSAAKVHSQGMEEFTNLRELNCDEPVDPPIDFSAFPNLESLWVSWEKGMSFGVFGLPKLENMTLLRYSGADFRSMPESKSMRRFDLRQSANSSIEGIQQFSRLKELSLSYMRNLTDLSPLRGLKDLESLHIENCPKLSDLSPIMACASLKRLHVEKVGSRWPDTRWVSALDQLESFANSAEFDSIDWRHIFKHRKLRDVRTIIRSDQDISAADIENANRAEGDAKVIVQRFGTKKKPSVWIEIKRG